ADSGNPAPMIPRSTSRLNGDPPVPFVVERIFARASCCGKVSMILTESTIQLPPARIPVREVIEGWEGIREKRAKKTQKASGATSRYSLAGAAETGERGA